MKQTKKPPETTPIETGLWKRVLKWEDSPVLTLSLAYPKLAEASPGLRRVGRYYKQVADQWRTRWETTLYRQACAAAEAALAASAPFRPWEVSLTYVVTHRSDDLLSLYMDASECTGGAHPLTVRSGDVWELPSGTPRSLRSFFPPKCRWKRVVLCEVQRQIEARIASGNSIFDAGWREKSDWSFDADHFYLTEGGLAVFYPLYAIAPHLEGIPVFFIPLPSQEQPVET